MKLAFDVTYLDGRPAEQVTARPRSFVAYEKTHKQSLSDHPDFSAMMWLAWHAAGSPDGSVEAWLENVDDCDPVSDDEDDEESSPGSSDS